MNEMNRRFRLPTQEPRIVVLRLMAPSGKDRVNKKAANKAGSQRSSGQVQIVDRSKNDCCDKAATNVITEFLDRTLPDTFPMMIAVTSRENKTAMHRPVNPIFAECPEDEPQKNSQQGGIIGLHSTACFVRPDHNPTDIIVRWQPGLICTPTELTFALTLQAHVFCLWSRAVVIQLSRAGRSRPMAIISRRKPGGKIFFRLRFTG